MARTRPLQQVGKAGQAVEQAAYQANALIRELQDGVTIRVIRDPSSPHNIMDFVVGRCDELPIAFRIEPKERT